MSANFWGVAPSTEGTRNVATWLPQIKEAGIGSVRAFDPSPDTDNLTPLLDAGMAVVGILWWSPPGSPLTMPLTDLAGWKAYVTETVTRYKGKVTQWEIWNEPPNFTEDKTPYAYAQCVAVAYDAAKAVDPTVQIGLAAKSNYVNYLAQAIEVGAANKFDFITLHPYESAELMLQVGEGHFMGIVPTVRKMLKHKNLAKAAVPIYFTEIGTQAHDANRQADLLIKVFVMALAQGVSRVFWFDPRDSEALLFGLLSGDGSKRVSYTAMQTLITHLGQAPVSVGWLNGKHRGFVFNTFTSTVLVAWMPLEKTSMLTLLSPAKIIDLETGAATTATPNTFITQRPILLTVSRWSKQAFTWRQEAKANKLKPFLWNENHAGLQSVSLDPTSEDNGIHLTEALPIKVVDGKAEFDATGRNGLQFTVDPAFMSYDTQAVKITAILRGHDIADPGFNFKYESDVPLYYTDWAGRVNTDSWHSVKGNVPYEKSWIVSNARFIGVFGYNFTFDTDGTNHSDFSLLKITVEKF